MEESASSSKQQTPSFSCQAGCSRFFCDDLTGSCRCTPSFRSGDANGKEIDIVRSFSPRGILVILWKVVVWGAQFFTFAMLEKGGGFYFAYATNWALILATFYSCFSLINSIFPVQQPVDTVSRSGWRVQVTWILFLLAANSELLVTILFWTLLYDNDTVLTIYAVMSHVGECALIWMDGFIVNRIPIRVRHWLEINIWFAILYLIWTVIHSSLVADIGNPNKEESDLIYPVLDWGEDPVGATIIAVICTFGLSPFIHLLMVGVSRCGRKYIKAADTDGDDAGDLEGRHGASKNGYHNYEPPYGSSSITHQGGESEMVEIYG